MVQEMKNAIFGLLLVAGIYGAAWYGSWSYKRGKEFAEFGCYNIGQMKQARKKGFVEGCFRTYGDEMCVQAAESALRGPNP